MVRTESLFATQIYRSPLSSGRSAATLIRRLRDEALAIAEEDRAGQAWSRAHNYQGYTSYASLTDLPDRSPAFGEFMTALAPHIGHFVRLQNFAIAPTDLRLNGLWINILNNGGVHTGHIHPLSVISGTYYVQTPKGSSALKFEDPRLGLMMAAPQRKASAPKAQQAFVYVAPSPGTLMLWESWLRHEVVMNHSQAPRISISFNFGWA